MFRNLKGALLHADTASDTQLFGYERNLGGGVDFNAELTHTHHGAGLEGIRRHMRGGGAVKMVVRVLQQDIRGDRQLVQLGVPFLHS